MDFQNKYDTLLSKTPGFGSLGWLDIKNESSYRSLTDNSSKYLTLAISTPGFENQLSTFLADKFNHNTSQYDRIIDKNYNVTGVGGSTLHHNLDGSHTFSGAMQALQEAFPDDSGFNRGLHMLKHLARDFTTPSGINPFLSPHEFTQTKSFLVESFHISKSKANDLLNFNLTELAGTAIASVALMLDYNDLQIRRLGEFVSRLSLSSYIAGNPALFFLSAIALAQSCAIIWQGESPLDFIDGLIGGGINAGSFFYFSTLFSPEIFIGLAIGTAACFFSSWVYSQVKEITKNDLDDIFSSQFRGYKSYLKLIG